MKSSSVHYTLLCADEDFLFNCQQLQFEKKHSAMMKTKISLSLTEGKFLYSSISNIIRNTPVYINEIDFINYANQYELKKINQRLQLKLIRSKNKFTFVFDPAEVLALNYFTPALIHCEAEAYLRIILDKIFQGATDQLHANILKLK